MKKETISDLTTEKTELKREIGAFGGVSIIAGIMIGSGIFYLGAYVLQRVGMNSGLALLCWIDHRRCHFPVWRSGLCGNGRGYAPVRWPCGLPE